MQIKVSDKEIEIHIDYNQELINIIKQIPGRKYRPVDKCWIIPKSRTSVKILLANGLVNEEITKLIAEYNRDYLTKLHINQLPINIDFSDINLELFDYQKRGVYFAVLSKRCIIADDLGLGKTVQAVVAAKKMGARKVLVICPKSIKYRWASEINRIYGDIPIYLVDGMLAPEKEISADWIIATYSHFSRKDEKYIKNGWMKYFREHLPDLIILDEAHRVKNRSANSSQQIKALCRQVENVILLSGTIILNRVTELYNLLNIVDPQEFNSFTDFAAQYSKYAYKIPVKNKEVWIYEGLKNEEDLKKRLVPFMIRRRKEEVLSQLPSKIRDFIEVDLEPDDRVEYRKMEDDYIQYLIDHGDLIKVDKAIRAEALVKANALMKFLSQKKAELSLDLIEDMIDEAGKLVVYVRYKESASIIHEYFSDRAVIITGEIDTKDRSKNLDKFINNDKINVCVLTYGSGAEGIDGLQYVCSNALMVDYDWTPSIMIQAEDRLYRIGMKSNVNINYMTVRNSIDEYIRDKVAKKLEVIEKTIGIDENILLSFKGNQKEVR